MSAEERSLMDEIHAAAVADTHFMAIRAVAQDVGDMLTDLAVRSLDAIAANDLQALVTAGHEAQQILDGASREVLTMLVTQSVQNGARMEVQNRGR